MIPHRSNIARLGGGKIHAFEGLRAVMAWWVVVGHVAVTVVVADVPGLSWILMRPALAVDVFIILSGFVIVRMMDFKRESYGPYLTRRACRIFPLYLVMLGLSASLLPLYLSAVQHTPLDSPKNALRLEQAQNTLDHFAAHLAVHLPLLHGLVPNSVLYDAAYTILGQSWSVSTEWQFYLVAPLMFILMGSRRGLLVLGAVCVALILLPAPNGAFIGQKVPYFAIGILTYLWAKADAGRAKAYLAGLLVVMALALVLDGAKQVVPLAIWCLACAAVGGVGLLRPLDRILSGRLLTYLGDRSYSVYLVHMVPLYLTMYALNATSLQGASYEAVLWASTVVWTLMLSALTYRVVERPGIALGAVLTHKDATSARGAQAGTPLAPT